MIDITSSDVTTISAKIVVVNQISAKKKQFLNNYF